MLYIRDMGMATYNLLNFKMRPVMWESMACMNLFAKERESCALFANGGSII